MLFGLLFAAACIVFSVLLMILFKNVEQLNQWRQSVTEICRQHVERRDYESE